MLKLRALELESSISKAHSEITCLVKVTYLLDQSFFTYKMEAMTLSQQACCEAHRGYREMSSAEFLAQAVLDKRELVLLPPLTRTRPGAPASVSV